MNDPESLSQPVFEQVDHSNPNSVKISWQPPKASTSELVGKRMSRLLEAVVCLGGILILLAAIAFIAAACVIGMVLFSGSGSRLVDVFLIAVYVTGGAFVLGGVAVLANALVTSEAWSKRWIATSAVLGGLLSWMIFFSRHPWQ